MGRRLQRHHGHRLAVLILASWLRRRRLWRLLRRLLHHVGHHRPGVGSPRDGRHHRLAFVRVQRSSRQCHQGPIDRRQA